MATITGTTGDDTLPGTSGDDQFNLIQGGEDTATGLGGNDIFSMGGKLDAGDSIDGGAGSDQVWLRGDYSAGVTFGPDTITNVEDIVLGTGYSYTLTTDDATVAAGQTMIVDGSKLAAGNILNFDGTAETDGHLTIIGGAGDDILKGGSDGDRFDLSHGGEDTATGGAGNDLFLVGGALDAGDKIDGGFTLGAANNIVRFDGDYSAGLTLGPDTLQNIQTLQFSDGFDYKITVDNANFLSGPTVLVNATSLGAGHSLTFDASASDASFHFIGGAGDDVLTGGTAADVFDLSHGGDDTASGGDLSDRFIMGTTFTAADTIDGGAGNDIVEISGMGSSDAITFSATTLTSVETLVLDSGFGPYTITTNDANVAAGATLLVRGESLSTAEPLTFDGSAETDGHFIIRGGQGDDTLTGGQQSDTFNMTLGGAETVDGQGGDDIINMGDTWDSDDEITGGTGNDTLQIAGADYGTAGSGNAFDIFQSMFVSIETLQIGAGHDYYLATFNQPVASGTMLTVDATALSAANILSFDGSSETGGNLYFDFGAGFTAADSLTGGAGNNTLELNGDYSGVHALVFGAATIRGIDSIVLDGGHDYGITTADANVAAGTNLSVDANALGAGDALAFDGTAETNGAFGFYFTGGFTAGDSIAGGAGSDYMVLAGDYTGANALVFGAATMTSVESLDLTGGDSYDITTNDATVAAGSELTVGSALLSATDVLTFNGSAETDGNFTFEVGANFTAADSLTGGAGNDTLRLDGDYTGGSALVFGAGTIASIETIIFDAGHSYNLTTNDANVAAGKTLTVDASALGAGDSLTFDGSAETNGFFAITGGEGDDKVTFGTHYSVTDTFNGGTGSDTLVLNNVHGTISFADNSIGSVEDLVVNGVDGDDITMTATDANVAAGDTMTVDFSGSGSLFGVNVSFDGSAETDGHFVFIGPQYSPLTDYFTGGALSDSLSLGVHEGATAFTGNGGDDTVTTIAGASHLEFDGGSGNDMLALTGGGTISVFQFTLTSVETMTLDDNNWTYAPGSTTFTTGATLTVDATALTASHSLTFDGSGATDGAFVFEFASGFQAGDSIIGGAGNDTLVLNGDYTGGVTFGASTISSIETITVGDGHSYDLTSNDANVASGATLTVDASALTGSNTLTFNGANETDGHFAFIGGAGDDDLEGGAQSDSFDLSLSNGAFVYGNGGNDSFTVISRAFLLADLVDGGAGSDTLVLNGDFSTATTLTAANINNVEAYTLEGAANSYDLVFAAGTSGGSTITVDASAAATLTADFSSAAVGVSVTGSAGNDTIITGNGTNTITGGAGADTLTGGTGVDTFVYTSAADSPSDTYADVDHITNFNGAADKFELGYSVHGLGGGVVTSANNISDSSFTDIVSAAFSHGFTHTEVQILVQGGALANHIFLCVDSNNNEFYDAGDLTIDITGATNRGSVTDATFI